MGVTLLCVISIYDGDKHRKATELSPGTTLSLYLEKHPNPIAIYKFTVNEKAFVFVIGHYPPGDNGLFYLASGPPAYIFDEAGALADWTDDNNEGRPFAPYWKSDHSKGGVPENATRITVEEASQFVKSR